MASDNAARHGVAERIEFARCDLLDTPSGAGPFDCIVSNPPYVREDEFDSLPRDVRLHEPRGALVAGPSGIEVIERLVALAPQRLSPGGWLVIEVGPSTAEAARGVIGRQPGLIAGDTLNDLAGLPRIVQARRA